ncbi:phage tail spike protein [Pseudogracilibacillus auburnensis]|uniref:phage tail spike protein n=1 Tax=Pseudogracilibacillus auburnensis TaxID=1494959 RepID=UPI001A95DE34|nr:phage tail spike protein [Pseudogracilibacillus auburnensis]MBO1002668.1 phage tail protein [Pseudogracilibacillus auburnensis]
MGQIHIIDGQKDMILDFIAAKHIIDDTHKKSLEDRLETYNFITFTDRRFSAELEKRNRIIIPDEDGGLVEFVIFEVAKYKDTEGHKAQVFTHASYLELKKASILKPERYEGRTASQHAGFALNKTGWRVGNVESTGTRTLSINEHTNPYEFLKRIAKEFELELRFRVEHDNNKITGRYVDLLERVGMWRGREVEFGKDLEGIKRIEKQDIVTALLGLGPEKDDGSRIEVLVEDFNALERWGWIDEQGNLNHLIESYEIQSDRTEMTETQARQYTRTALNKRINTQVTYECTIVDLENVPGLENKKIRFGDTIKIKDTSFNPPLYLEARVFEQERSIKTTAKKDIKLGDFIEYTEEQVHAIWKQLQKQIQNRVTIYDLNEYTYSKFTIDNKDEGVYQDGTYYADAVSDTAESNAKAYAVEQDDLVKEFAENVAEAKSVEAIRQANADTIDYVQNYANKKISQQPAPPNNPETGDLWIDTSKQPYVWKQWDGTDWKKATATDLSELDGELQSAQIAVGAIDADRLANNAVTVNKILNGAISEAKIAADAVTSIKIANNAVNNDKLANLSVDAAKLTDDSVTETKIANLAVGSAAIQNLAVKNQHVYSLHANKITAGIIAAERVAIGSGTQFCEGYDPTKIEIGGKNLLKGTTDSWRNINHSQYYADLTGALKIADLGLEVGDYLTFKVYIKTGSIAGAQARFRWHKSDNTNHSNSMGTKIGKSTEGWVELSAKIPSQTDNVRIVVNATDNGTNSGTFQYKYLKAEKGNKATDWTPAPEDNPALLWRYRDTVYIDGGNIYANTITANEIATGTITANELASNSITAAKIASNAITAAKIQANAVTSAKIAADAVTAAKIAANSISSNMIATAGLDAGVVKFGTMSGERIATRTIAANRIATGTLTANELASNSVTAVKIASNAVTADKIAANAVTAGKISVNNLSAITANLGTVTAGTLRTVRLEGATGVFSGKIQAPQLTVEIDNPAQFADFGLRLQTAEWQPSTSNPYKITGFIKFETKENGVYVVKENTNGSQEAMDGFVVAAKNSVFSDSVSVSSSLSISKGSISGGLQLGHAPTVHALTEHNTNKYLVIYPQRYSEQDRFRIRSHNQKSDYVNDFRIDVNGYMRVPGVYYSTTTNSANVRVGTTAGLFTRNTSLRKYKLNIDTVDDPYKILNLNARTWYDKGDVERYAEAMHLKSKGENYNLDNIEFIKRIGGLIAEEVVDAGLEIYAEYDEKGKLNGIAYDRLWTLLIPIVRELKEEIKKIKEVLKIE